MHIHKKHAAGFTLIELLMVVGMVGIFMAAVFSLYQTHQRAAYTQEETAEVQQNLRVAMDRLMGDVRMAGFLVTAGTNSLAAFTDGAAGAPDTVTLNTASASMVIARNTSATQDVNLLAGDSVHVSVNSIDTFAVGDMAVIVGGMDANLVIPDTFDVTTVNDVADGPCGGGAVAAPCLTLQAVSGGAGSIKPGDMIVRIGAGPYPNTVSYQIIANTAACPTSCLQRTTNDGVAAQIIANNIMDLQFTYLLQNGTEDSTPTDLSQVRGVRVTLAGQRVNTAAFTGGVAQGKALVSVAGIRNF